MSEENQELKITLKIIGNNYEISTIASIMEISDELDNLISFIDELNIKLESGIASEIPTEEEIETAPSEEIPVIRPSRSTMENIEKLFDTEWGKAPRSAAEVMKALEVNAVPDKAPTVSTYLYRLTRRGILRRVEREGLWHYYKIPTELEE